ncbi:Uncharacterised protein [Chlamydia trachomatis]|nr:Uncharacterised protein [Chlamydia trachomatis]CRH90013.1 Uncharacterised protein [Chlamydia trachomatis]
MRVEHVAEDIIMSDTPSFAQAVRSIWRLYLVDQAKPRGISPYDSALRAEGALRGMRRAVR